MTYHLRLLHVSDIAAAPATPRGGRRSGSRWQDPLDHLDPLRGKAGIDLVCYAGGAAGPERGAEPAAGPAFLQPLLDRLGLGRERLFVVPHARSPVSPPESGNEERSYFGFRREVRLDRLPFGVQVIAFDSPSPRDGAPAAASLRSAAMAIDRLTAGPRGEALPGFRLGLVRQSLTGIDRRTAAALRLAGRVDLLLSGCGAAIDVASGAAWRTSGGDDLREVSVSPRGEPTAGPGGPRIACQLITVTCDAAGRPERLILRLRGAAPVEARGGRTAAAEVAFREALPRPANDEPQRARGLSRSPAPARPPAAPRSPADR